MGRKAKIGKVVLHQAKLSSTVADIVRETGVKPNTVRVILMRAAAKGSIHLTRFYRGRSSRTIKIVSHDDTVEASLNGLICGWCGESREMKSITLEIDETKTSEHELFRACIQSAVALEQDGWSRNAQKEQAQRLRIIAHHYVGPAEFMEGK